MYRANYFKHSLIKIWLTLVISLSLVATPAFTASRASQSERNRLLPPMKRAEQTAPAASDHSAGTAAKAQENYGKVPLGFEANQGQTDPRVEKPE